MKSVLTLCATAAVMFGQAAQQARVIGVVMEKQGVGAKVKNDAGEVYSIVFAPETKFQKIAPGQTSLQGATAITMADISDGDRVLARGTATDPKTIVALSVILMSKTDLADKQQKERQDWTKRGISGTVTAVDAAKKEITIRLPQLATAEHLVKVSLKDNAPLRRYAQDSVKFSDAKVAQVSDVKPGDQLRARGDKSEDGTKFAADEIVTGSFQTLAAQVVSVNADAHEMQIKDLDSNKVMTVKLTADSTLKRLPDMPMGGGMRGPGGPGGEGAPGAASGPGGGRPGGPGGPGGGPGGPGGGTGMMGGRMPDIQQMLERLPQSTLTDVKPGETVIVASTKGASADRMTAITVLGNAERFVAMRRAMAARAGAAAGAGNNGPGGNWNLGDMSMMIPSP